MYNNENNGGYQNNGYAQNNSGYQNNGYAQNNSGYQNNGYAQNNSNYSNNGYKSDNSALNNGNDFVEKSKISFSGNENISEMLRFLFTGSCGVCFIHFYPYSNGIVNQRLEVFYFSKRIGY